MGGTGGKLEGDDGGGLQGEVALGGISPLGGRAGARRLRAALAVVRRERQPSVLQMWSIYREVRGKIPAILKRCGTQSVKERPHPLKNYNPKGAPPNSKAWHTREGKVRARNGTLFPHRSAPLSIGVFAA